MPGGNGTGPAGMGPMTGRAAGFCAGSGVPGYVNRVGGRGYFGWDRGFGNRGVVNPYTPYGSPFAAPLTVEQELDSLKSQAKYLEDSLDGIKKRIEELECR